MDFVDAEVPVDTVPEIADVEYPCRVCGREAGPYGGRGRKPTLCEIHKKGTGAKSVPRITGSVANQAAQATAVLVQLNGMIALGMMALGMNQTASAIAGANDQFEMQAHAALLTDPDLCRLILKSGAKSAKVSLAIAYGGLGVAVVPTAIMEAKEKKAVRDAEREMAEDGTRT